jgi:Ni,Fe-hydrogenase III small subunit/NAD-dependent dihydropyrimidine dehydrogenase PreA subunit
MIKALLARLQQGHRTSSFPDQEPTLPDRFRGRPALDATKCPDGCSACVDVCPTDAIKAGGGQLAMDLGRCLFCTECTQACPTGAVEFTADYRLATRSRSSLLITSPSARHETSRALAMGAELWRLFGRSLKLRVVSAGGCNGCEADVSVLGTIVFDLGRFGIQFVASPRHADGLLITGPVTENMRLALQKTYEAVPNPKIVIAVGACAISGGPYVDHAEVHNGAGSTVPVDLYIPGCPPHPYTILEGLVGFLGRATSRAERLKSVIETEEEVRQENARFGLVRAEEAVRALGADLGKTSNKTKPSDA